MFCGIKAPDGFGNGGIESACDIIIYEILNEGRGLFCGSCRIAKTCPAHRRRQGRKRLGSCRMG